jgi:hypothetical protein
MDELTKALIQATRALLDAFGGDVPAWLTPEWDALAELVDQVPINAIPLGKALIRHSPGRAHGPAFSWPEIRDAIEPMLVLATDHVRQPTLQALEAGTVITTCHALEHGPLVYIGTLPDAPLPDDLEPVVALARRAGAIWIKFDADAANIAGLPVYDWEADDAEPGRDTVASAGT